MTLKKNYGMMADVSGFIGSDSGNDCDINDFGKYGNLFRPIFRKEKDCFLLLQKAVKKGEKEC